MNTISPSQRKIAQLLLSVSILSLMFAGGLVFLHTPTRAADQCVDPGGGGGCFTTIQAAINAVGSDETVSAAYPNPFVGGGGVRIWGGGADNDTLILQNNHLLYNIGAVFLGNANIAAEGGGMSVGRIATTQIISNEISYNTLTERIATSGSGGFGGRPSGGGMYIYDGDTVTITDSQINNNVTANDRRSPM